MSNQINLVIEGMHCQACVAKVENSLKNIESLENVSVNLEKGQASADYMDEKPTDKTLRRAIDQAGFTLVSVN